MEKKTIKILIFLILIMMFCFLITPNKSYAATKRSLNSCSIFLSRKTYTYTGSACKPTVTIKYNGSTVSASHYTVSYKNCVNPGTATVTVTAISTSSSYKGSISASYKINKRSILNTKITLSQTSFTYDGTSRMPTVTVKYDGKALTKGTHFLVNNLDNIVNIGNNKRIQIRGIGNYEGEVIKYINITPRSIRNATVKIPYNSYEYTGQAIKPIPTVVLDGKTLVNNKDYYITYKNNTNIGANALVVISGKGNYKDTAQKGFTITKPVIVPITNCTVSIVEKSFEYDGKAKNATILVKNGSKTLVKGTDYTVTYSNNINAGTATAKVVGKGKYSGSKSLNYTIERKSIANFDISLTRTNYTYTGLELKPDVTIIDKSHNKKLVQDKEYKVANYIRNVEPGTATVIIYGINNYAGLVHKYFTINKKSISSFKLQLVKYSYIYDGTAKRPGVSLYDNNNNKLIEGTDYEVFYSNNSYVGEGVAYVKGIGHYKDTLTREFNITPASLNNCIFSLNPSTYVYTGNAITPNPLIKTANGNYTLVKDRDYKLSYSNNTYAKDFESDSSGKAQITITGMGNFTGTKNLEFTITTNCTGNNIVSYPKGFIGTPYVGGGDSPAGFDCSGFTKYVYGHFGYLLEHNATAQRGYGQRINSINQLKAGDIVCFSGHVGIYVGNNSFIHAPATGRTVCITNFYNDSIDGSYYGNTFICGVRIIN